MKIKKDDYNREISNAYACGFDKGIKFALLHPELTVAHLQLSNASIQALNVLKEELKSEG